MKIDSLAVGSIGTNCYILQDEAAKLCAVIDPGDEPERILSAVEQTGCTPTMILLTHGHFDHYTAVKGLLEKWPELPVYIHESDVTDKPVSSFGLLFPRLPDFAGGSYEDILRSLKKLAQLPGQYQVYPGHDRSTNLDFERRVNPYVKQGLRK